MRYGMLAFAVLGLSLCATAVGQTQSATSRPRLQNARALPIPVDDAALQRQFDVLKSMPSANVRYSKRGPVAYISGDLGMVFTHTEKDQVVEEVWVKFKDVLLATGQEELTVAGDGTDRFFRDVALTQTIRGIPVVRGAVKLRIDPHTGRILEFGAGFIPDRGLAKAPKLTAQQAADTLVAELEGAMIAKKGSIRIAERKTLAYLAMHDEKAAQLVWEMLVSYVMELGGDNVSEVVWVDAVDGTVAAREPADRYESVWIPSPGTAPDRNNYPAGVVQLTDAQIAANPAAVKVKENFATTSAPQRPPSGAPSIQRTTDQGFAS